MDLDDVVASAVAGDESAFITLYRALQPPLLRYLRVLTPSGAEDAASETWAAAVTHLARFTGGERELRSWLFTIARSKVIDQTRQQARRPVQLTDEPHHLDRPDPQDVALEVIDAMTPDLAVALLAALPADQAEVITLRVLGGFDTAEVSRLTGKSPGAVRVAQHRGLKRLAALLAQARTAAAVTR